jgi:hypothetical protein
VSSLDELTALVPPPEDPAPVAPSDLELPPDYRALIDRYGLGNLAGLRLLPPAEIPYEAVRQRAALLDIETPYAPEDLLPWGIDESGNVVWWLTETEGDWPVVANEARGEEWHRHDGGAVSFLTELLSGRETSDFLVIEGDDFEPYSSSERPG